HALMLALSLFLFGREVRFDILLRLLSSSTTADDHRVIGRDIYWIFFYFASALGLSICSASVAKWFVSKFRLDRKDSPFSGIFRFKRAPWYYLLSGADFAENDVPDFVQI